VTVGPAGGHLVWSKLVSPSYRTIDLRCLLDDASQVLPEPPFDVIHLVTAQDLVDVRLTVTEQAGPSDPPSTASAEVTGVVHLPAGLLYVDPPAAPLPDRLKLSRAGRSPTRPTRRTARRPKPPSRQPWTNTSTTTHPPTSPT
jgi:hypothetical protein